ncbi:phosphopantetheine-binding protein [Streptomyces sp. JNUCC 64]
MNEHVDIATDALPRMVRRAWRTALEHEDFAPDSDFFAVGGNSYLVALVMTDLSRQVGVRLPLRLFFDAPTVHGVERAVAGFLTDGSR